MALRSWNCKGCTNVCYMIYAGQVGQYCRAYYDKTPLRTKWIGDTIVCLNYTTDPEATDPQVRFWKEKE